MSTKHVLKYQPVQTGSLIGLGVMVFAGSANAGIVSSTTATSLSLNKANTSKTITIGATNVQLTNTNAGEGKSYASSLTLSAAPGSFVTSNVGLGTVIGAHLAASSAQAETLLQSTDGKGQNVTSYTQNGLYGYSFVDSNNVTNYGWARITANYDGKALSNSLVATVNAFAHTTAGENILAGLPTATTAVPEADTLAMLAAGVGLIGLTVQRRRKAGLAKADSKMPLAA